MDILWQSVIFIIVQCLNAWTNTHSQYLVIYPTQMESCSTILKLNVIVEFPVHHMTHRRKSCVLCVPNENLRAKYSAVY